MKGSGEEGRLYQVFSHHRINKPDLEISEGNEPAIPTGAHSGP